MADLSEKQLQKIFEWLSHGSQATNLPDAYFESPSSGRARIKTSSMGIEPTTGREAIYVRDLISAKRMGPEWWNQPMTGPEAQPLEKIVKDLKGKAVFFSPDEGPATMKQANLLERIGERHVRRGTRPPPRVKGKPLTLTERALNQLDAKGAQTRTKLFEKVLRSKSLNLPQGFKMILPMLLMAALLGKREESDAGY